MASGEKDFRKEFEELGRERVRSDLLFGRLPPEKRTAARLWVEQADAESWQKGRGDKPRRKSLMQSETIKKWLPYLGGAAILLFALARMLRRA